MILNKYKNIRLTNNIEEANCITHSGRFHVDDVISTIFISKIIDEVVLIRIPNIKNKNMEGKIIYDIGLGKFDHHQKLRNGKRENGIYYSSIGLLWKEFGKSYLEKLGVKNIDKVFEYIDKELIQFIDAEDNMQTEYLKNKIMPDFIKLCNPEWNENISEDEAFINALKLADEFWKIYAKHAIAEVEAIEILLDKIEKCSENYLILDKEMPYKKAVQLADKKIKYIIFKSRREGYDIRTVLGFKFNNKLVQASDISIAREITKIEDLIYVDIHGKLCCTKTLESAIKLVEYNEEC